MREITANTRDRLIYKFVVSATAYVRRGFSGFLISMYSFLAAFAKASSVRVRQAVAARPFITLTVSSCASSVAAALAKPL